MNGRLRGLVVVVAVAVALAWCSPAMAQVLRGSISGTVIDPHGAVVSGAQVKVTDISTGFVFTTTSDSSGLFRLNLLPVGRYNVTITAQGFKTAEAIGIAVAAGADSGLGSLHMAVGELSETAEVTSEAPFIRSTQSQVTNVFSGVTLDTFSGTQENEGLDRLALFIPGIASSRSNNFSNTNGAAFSVQGLSGRNNDQQIDGQSNNDNNQGGPELFLSDPNFVQQYVVVTNNFGPEYGRNAGSVVNIITKSGTNAWHGSLFGSENNSFLNAMSSTQRNTPKPGTVSITNPNGISFTGPPRSNEEFTGGTIGGPMVKNKAFIFGGFDDDIISTNSTLFSSLATPTPNGLATLAGCGAGNINPASLAVLQNFGPYAFPIGKPTPVSPFLTQIHNRFTAAGFPGPIVCANVELGGVIRVVPVTNHVYHWLLRGDLQRGADTFTTRYIALKEDFVGSDNGAGGWFDDSTVFSQDALIGWTHNFSAHMVNELRGSYGRENIGFGGGSNPFEPAFGKLPDALTNISFQGAFLGIGPATNIPQGRIVNTWQAQDNWNYVLGKHSFKAGVNWTYQRSPNIFLPLINGTFRYSDLSAFLSQNRPNRVQIAQGQSNLDFREHDTFLYFGDDWKLAQNLTMNLGLTWSYYGSPVNLFNSITDKRESNPSTAFWLQSLPLSVRTTPNIPAVKNSVGPSVGFAYSPQWGGYLTGNGKTVFRGGYRLLYDPAYYNIFLNIASSAPAFFQQNFSQTTASGLTGGLPTTSFGVPAVPTGPNVRALVAPQITFNTFDPRTTNETNVPHGFSPDKVHAWSFGFERELTRNSAFEARYTGNHAVNLFQTVNGNPYLGTVTAPGLLQAYPQFVPSGLTPCAATTQSGPGAGTDVGRASCGTGVLRTRGNGGFSDYHALQLEFRANNLFKQLTMRTGYTWSKTLDNTSEIFSTGGGGNTLFASQNPFEPGGAERSISGLDYPGVWTILFTEQLPFFKEQHGAVGHLLGGWSLAGNYIVASGQPYTPIQGLAEAANSDALAGVGNFYDSAFVGALVGSDIARPFYGSKSAPANQVGIYAGDFCRGIFRITPAANPLFPGACNTLITNPNSLLSFNSMNANGSIASAGAALPGNPGVPVSPNSVRFIINGSVSQGVFGTPFGNVPRGALRDAITNIANFSVFKNIKLSEHANFEVRATALNAFNHFNFSGIDPNLEDAAVARPFADFANPHAAFAGGRTFFVGGKITF